MNRPDREAILRRLLVCAPDQTLADADNAVIQLMAGDCIPLILKYNIPHSEMARIVQTAWGLSGTTTIEAKAYRAIDDYLDRIGVGTPMGLRELQSGDVESIAVSTRGSIPREKIQE